VKEKERHAVHPKWTVNQATRRKGRGSPQYWGGGKEKKKTPSYRTVEKKRIEAVSKKGGGQAPFVPKKKRSCQRCLEKGGKTLTCVPRKNITHRWCFLEKWFRPGKTNQPLYPKEPGASKKQKRPHCRKGGGGNRREVSPGRRTNLKLGGGSSI